MCAPPPPLTQEVVHGVGVKGQEISAVPDVVRVLEGRGQGQSCWDRGSQLASESGAHMCVLQSFNSPSLRTYHPCLQEMANKQVSLMQGDENSETRVIVNLETRSGRASWWR